MCLDKFAAALRLRWPWLERMDSSKIWAGSSNPCSEADMDIFYAATKITIGNGCKISFWDAPWLEGRKPKEIAPLIFECLKRKSWKINKSMEANV
jgi:hypothetical protein